MTYTIHDNPEIVKRIKGDLAHITQRVVQADPSLRSLVLTGGFARGEGAVLEGQPQNDYDLIALRNPTMIPARYKRVRAELEADLGLHIDLAPVSLLRLPWVGNSIFWYETALRGRVLWGPDLLDQIPVVDARDLDPAEGLRLLVNRAAGLLLATRQASPAERRLQASKALLACLDARLLCLGRFAPSQTERWQSWRSRQDCTTAPTARSSMDAWISWAYHFKVDPGATPRVDANHAWRAAAEAVRATVPLALHHAGFRSLHEYSRRDRLADRLFFLPQLVRRPQLWRVAWNPTSHVRVATLRMLFGYLDRLDASHGDPMPKKPYQSAEPAIADLEGLRHATLQ